MPDTHDNPDVTTTSPTTSDETRYADAPSGADGWEIADLVAVGVLDAVTGQPPVPISVWRATDPGAAPTRPQALYEGLTPRVAAILLAVYTDPGDLILDATADPVVAGAAGAGGRRYQLLQLPAAAQAHVPADGQSDGATMDDSADRSAASAAVGGAGLVLLRWPAPAPAPAPVSAAGAGSADPMLEVCAASLAADGHTVAILAPPVGGVYRDHARALIDDAARAGLGYLQHIVVITSTGPELDNDEAGEDDGSLPSDPGAATAEGSQRPAGEPAGRASRREHLDLLVLVLRPSPPRGRVHGRAKGRTARPVPAASSGLRRRRR